MNLKDELQQLTASWKPAPVDDSEPALETEEELYERVKEACKARARMGCHTVSFPWLYCDATEQWKLQHPIREAVVYRLQMEGLTRADGQPKSFTENRVWNEWNGEYDPLVIQHRITVDW